MAVLSPQGPFRALDGNGDPLAGGKLYTYEAGTTTPKTTYTTEDATTPNTNPVILDSNGYADVWLDTGSYKFVLDDSDDVEQWTLDDISGSDTSVFGAQVVTQATNLNLTSIYRNNLIVTTAGLTISLLAAATATEGFIFSVQNTSSSNVTIDPDGAETINGNATLTIPPNGGGTIVCDGSNWQILSMVTVSADGDNTFTGTNTFNAATSGFGIVPIGATVPYYGTTAPNSSWLFPVGQAISRTTYADLFALIGTTYGSGDGSTTFNLPDVRARDQKALDNMGGSAASRISGFTSLGDTGGVTGTSTTEGHALTAAEMTHKHETTVVSPAKISQTGAFGTGSTTLTTSNEGGANTSSGNGHLTNTPESVTSSAHDHDIAQANLLDPYIGCNVLMRVL